MLTTFLAYLTLLAASQSGVASAHSVHTDFDQLARESDADWATKHMISEHHIMNFDPNSFFQMHDFDSDGFLEHSEIWKLYGFDHDSTKDVSEQVKQEAILSVMVAFDHNRDGQITMLEWMTAIGQGVTLPDPGLGPGHDHDDEEGYELHHYQLYHSEDVDDSKLTHPEDIEHYAKHDHEEDEAERQAFLDSQTVIRENIPAKFRRQ